MPIDTDAASPVDEDRYRGWLRSIAEGMPGLFLLVDSGGVLIDGVAHGALQKRLCAVDLVAGVTIQQLLPLLSTPLEQSLMICRHTGHIQRNDHSIDDPKGSLFLKTQINRNQHNCYSIIILDAHHERSLALQIQTLSADQRQTVRLLHEMDSRYRTLFDALTEGVVFVAKDGQILATNEAAAQLFHTTVSEFIKLRLNGPLPFQFVDEEMQPLSVEQRPIFNTLHGGQTRQGFVMGVVFSANDPSASITWIAVNSRPLWRPNDSLPYAAVVSFYDITLQKQLERELHHRAFHDPLTSLPNRSLFIDRLDTSIRQARRTGDIVAVFFLDLDGFKAINDVSGHDTGDRFLQAVAQRLSASLRDGDTVARFGGDEFTILLPTIQTAEDALRVAERVLEELHQPIVIDGTSYTASASLGISLYPHDGNESSTLIRHADLAMYRVKAQGRNNCQFFREEINLATTRCLSRENVLSQEIARDLLRLRFRPYVLLKTEQVEAWEAELYRPAHEDREQELISEASLEEGLAQQLFRHLVDQACRAFQHGINLRRPSELLVVKISQRHLVGATAVISVATALERSGLSPERLEVDVTPSGNISDPVALVEPLLQLHHLGVRLSLSSSATTSLPLEYLPHLPVSSMTLPEPIWRRSFEDQKTAALCEGLIALAERLGLSVTAAGINSHSERQTALTRGCRRGHGPLWPMVSALPEPPFGQG